MSNQTLDLLRAQVDDAHRTSRGGEHERLIHEALIKQNEQFANLAAIVQQLVLSRGAATTAANGGVEIPVGVGHASELTASCSSSVVSCDANAGLEGGGGGNRASGCELEVVPPVVNAVMPHPKVPHSACVNCQQLLCCCVHKKYSRCLNTCIGCTPDPQYHNRPEDVQATIDRDIKAREAVDRCGIMGIQTNIMSGLPSGAEFPPSHEPYCTNPTKSVESAVVHIKSEPLGPTEQPRYGQSRSLFEFFRANPHLVNGSHDDATHDGGVGGAGGVRKAAGFFTRLSPEDTENIFKSRVERSLHSHNLGSKFSKIDHPAQHLWEARDAHVVMREINLQRHTSLPGEWSINFETAMPCIPTEAFKGFFEIQPNDSIYESFTNQDETVERVANEAREMIDVTTSAAITHTELARHAHVVCKSKPMVETASETLFNHQDPPDIVRCDKDGFRTWCNKNETGFWARQEVSVHDETTTTSTTIDEESDGSYAASPSPSSSSSSFTSPSATRGPFKSTASGKKPSFNRQMTADKNNKLIPVPAANVYHMARVSDSTLEHYVPAGYISHYDTALLTPQNMYESFISTCTIRTMVMWMGQEYGELVASLKEQLERSLEELGMVEMHPYSKIVVADADRISMRNGKPVVCASSSLAKFITDIVLPFLAQANQKKENPVNGDQLRDAVVALEDMLRVVQVSMDALQTFSEPKSTPPLGALKTNGSSKSFSGMFSSSFSSSVPAVQTEAQIAQQAKQAIVTAITQHAKLSIPVARRGAPSSLRRAQTFKSDLDVFRKELDKCVDTTTIAQLLVSQRKLLLKERLEMFNALFRNGFAHTWIDGNKLEMFINYVDVIRFCLGMVSGLKWWTNCADLKPGIRVSFEWADHSISLASKLSAIEDEVVRAVRVLRRLQSSTSSYEDDRPIDIAQIMREPSDPNYPFVFTAIRQLSDETRAWFEPNGISTSWMVHYTPVWKHIVLKDTTTVVDTALVSLVEGGLPLSAEDMQLTDRYSVEQIRVTRTQYEAIWDVCTLDVKRGILEKKYKDQNA